MTTFLSNLRREFFSKRNLKLLVIIISAFSLIAIYNGVPYDFERYHLGIGFADSLIIGFMFWIMLGTNVSAARSAIACQLGVDCAEIKDESTMRLVQEIPITDQFSVLKYLLPALLLSIVIAFLLGGVLYQALQEIGVIDDAKSFFKLWTD